MSDQPLTLTDDDFTDDAPPGYLSQKSKEKYIPWMATLLGGTFVLQLILPAVIMMIMMPMMMFQGMSKGMPQYTKMAAWQDALWYPTVDGPGGGGRGGCKLSALDYEGQPLDRPVIELDMQPQWLLADGEKLWAVSNNEVVEIIADGSRPVVMHPTRFLRHASQPFFYEGKPAVVDWDDNHPPQVFEFVNGEWNPVAKLSIPDFSPVTAAEDAEPVEENAPADALLPEHRLEETRKIQQAREQVNQRVQRQLNQNVAITLGTGVAEDVIQAVVIAENVHVVLGQNSLLYYHQGMPIQNSDAAAGMKTNWTQLEVNARSWTLTTVDEVPAMIVQSNQFQPLELWRLVDRRWQNVAKSDASGGGPRSSFSAFTTPGGGRTFAVVESMGGLSQELLELKPNEMVTVTQLQSFMPFVNPFSPDYFRFQFLLQIPGQILMVVMILGTTWLMQRHRDPYYYKGRIPVEYASILRRCCAVFIDMMINMSPVYLVGYLWYAQSDMTMAKFLRMIESDNAALWIFLWSLVPILVGIMGWFFFCEIVEWLMISFGGCTIGKYLCGVRVARTNLQQPGLFRGFVRNLLSWIELPLFNGIIAFALVAFLQNRQRLADLVAGTVVVKAGSLRAARAALLDAKPAE